MAEEGGREREEGLERLYLARIREEKTSNIMWV